MREYKVPWSGVGAKYDQAAIEVVTNAMKNADPLTQGPYQKEFEDKFNDYIGAKASFAVNSCTSALQLCADLLRVDKGDEVIVPAHTYCASATPFAKSGAVLKWADIDPDSRLVTAETIKPLITSKTKVIVVVHLYGLVCDMDPIMDLANKHGIKVVEDCAQSPGAEYKGKKSGTIGILGCFSFHTHKNISTLGEGGMLTVNDENMVSLVPGLRHNGHCSFENQNEYWKPAMSNVDFDIDGQWPNNFCIGEVQCALGTHMLTKLDKLNSDRIKRANYIKNELKNYPELSFQKPNHPECQNIYHLLVARYSGNQDKLFSMLSKKYLVKVINPYYPLYKYDLYKKAGMGEANCPELENYFNHIIAFPFHHWLTDEQVDYMIDSIKKSITALRGE